MKGVMTVKELNESGLYVSEMDWDERYKSKSNPKGNFIRIIEPISNGDSGVIYYLKTDDGYLVEGECYIIEDRPVNVNRTVSEWIAEYQKKPFNYVERDLTDYLAKTAAPIVDEGSIMRVQTSYVKYYIGQTTDEDIKAAYQMLEQEKSVINKIMEEMASDGENESDKLLALYEESTKEERALLDSALIAICGWSLHTIIEMMKSGENSEETE